jgi:hypothetical protein
MLYCKEYSNENAAELLKKIDDEKVLDDGCYETSPLKPALVPLFRIFAESQFYKRYMSKKRRIQLVILISGKKI